MHRFPPSGFELRQVEHDIAPDEDLSHRHRPDRHKGHQSIFQVVADNAPVDPAAEIRPPCPGFPTHHIERDEEDGTLVGRRSDQGTGQAVQQSQDDGEDEPGQAVRHIDPDKHFIFPVAVDDRK